MIATEALTTRNPTKDLSLTIANTKEVFRTFEMISRSIKWNKSSYSEQHECAREFVLFALTKLPRNHRFVGADYSVVASYLMDLLP